MSPCSIPSTAGSRTTNNTMSHIINESNPHLRRQQQITEARNRWNESEWLLNHLRTQGQTKPKQLNDEELLSWNQPTHSIARIN